MSELGGLWKHENNQHALVSSPKTECGCPSAGGIKNGHIRYPLLWRNERRKKERIYYYNITPGNITPRLLTRPELSPVPFQLKLGHRFSFLPYFSAFFLLIPADKICQGLGPQWNLLDSAIIRTGGGRPLGTKRGVECLCAAFQSSYTSPGASQY